METKNIEIVINGAHYRVLSSDGHTAHNGKLYRDWGGNGVIAPDFREGRN